LGDDGAISFASGLSRNFVLEELDLSGALFSIIPNNKVLGQDVLFLSQKLNLVSNAWIDNRIGDRGGNALAAALETSHLVMLNLRCTILLNSSIVLLCFLSSSDMVFMIVVILSFLQSTMLEDPALLAF
jgi:hypothetical protein